MTADKHSIKKIQTNQTSLRLMWCIIYIIGETTIHRVWVTYIVINRTCLFSTEQEQYDNDDVICKRVVGKKFHVDTGENDDLAAVFAYIKHFRHTSRIE